MAPLTRVRAGSSHIPTDMMVDYYSQRASSGLIMTECTMVDSFGRLIFHLPELSLMPTQPFQRIPMAKVTQLKIELEQEEDGRWIGEVPTLPGVMAYGATKAAALGAVQALALRAMADRLEHDEAVPEELLNVSFIAA
jgi:predicted RNase H-like HicB family nuclease